MSRRTRIPIKTPREIDFMRKAGAIASTILQTLSKEVSPGRTTGEIDQLAAEMMREYDCKSAFLG